MGQYVRRALGLISGVVDPEIVGIGGGVTVGFSAYADKLKESCQKHCFAGCAAMRIDVGALGYEAGMYGAAYCALQERGR